MHWKSKWFHPSFTLSVKCIPFDFIDIFVALQLHIYKVHHNHYCILFLLLLLFEHCELRIIWFHLKQIVDIFDLKCTAFQSKRKLNAKRWATKRHYVREINEQQTMTFTIWNIPRTKSICFRFDVSQSNQFIFTCSFVCVCNYLTFGMILNSHTSI